MAKHFVANTLWRVIDRAVQVHGALGYSTDTPLAEMLTQARWARFAGRTTTVDPGRRFGCASAGPIRGRHTVWMPRRC